MLPAPHHSQPTFSHLKNGGQFLKYLPDKVMVKVKRQGYKRRLGGSNEPREGITTGCMFL
jgi:hypothetical protein